MARPQGLSDGWRSERQQTLVSKARRVQRGRTDHNHPRGRTGLVCHDSTQVTWITDRVGSHSGGALAREMYPPTLTA